MVLQNELDVVVEIVYTVLSISELVAMLILLFFCIQHGEFGRTWQIVNKQVYMVVVLLIIRNQFQPCYS